MPSGLLPVASDELIRDAEGEDKPSLYVNAYSVVELVGGGVGRHCGVCSWGDLRELC